MEQIQYPHKIKFVLGDWSDDGHGKAETYLVACTHEVEYLRELHYKLEELGIDPGSWASDYESNLIPEDQIDALVKAGIDVAFSEYCLYRDEGDSPSQTEGSYYCENIDGLLNMWLDCLNLIDKDVHFQVVTDNVPTMHFYGRDKQGRHLRVPGYGMFI